MSFARLISTDYVFLNTTIDKNVDPDLLNPSITIAQDVEIQQILGYDLYQYIMYLIENNSIDNPTYVNYKNLLNNFIQPALAHWTVYYALPELQYRLTNKSILSKTSDSSVNTGLDELIYLRNTTKHYCDYYNQRIREYIINNPTMFPQYFQTTGIDRIRPARTTYFSGWSSNKYFNKRPNSNYGDPDCCNDPWGQPLNW